MKCAPSYSPELDEPASDVIRRAIEEGTAKIEITPAIRVHITAPDGTSAHFSTCEDEDNLPSPNYIADLGMESEDIDRDLAAKIGEAFQKEIAEAIAKVSTERPDLGAIQKVSVDRASEWWQIQCENGMAEITRATTGEVVHAVAWGNGVAREISDVEADVLIALAVDILERGSESGAETAAPAA